MSIRTKTVLILFATCMMIGGTNHALDIARGGLLPYRGVPMPLNAFWTLLCPLDFAAALLLWRCRNWGIVLALVIIVTDVAVNSWVLYGSGLIVPSFEPLQVQTLVLGFMSGAAAFVWRRDAEPARCAER
jgi:hypothetical protein